MGINLGSVLGVVDPGNLFSGGDSGGGFIGDTVKGVWNDFTGKSGAEEANAANLGIAREQMAFQERMSNTAHVREVQDLKNAGLNPMLSVNSGASTPAGASATMQNPEANVSSSVMGLLNFALSALQTSAEVNKTRAETTRNVAETLNVPKVGELLGKQVQSEGYKAEGLRLGLTEKELGQKLSSEFKGFLEGSGNIADDLWKILDGIKRKTLTNSNKVKDYYLGE